MQRLALNGRRDGGERIDPESRRGGKLQWAGGKKIKLLKEKVVNTSFFSISHAILSRRKYLVVLFLVCFILLLHALLANISLRLVPESLETLDNLARKAYSDGNESEHIRPENEPPRGTFYRIAGHSLVDTVDWLHPANLGFELFSRSNATLEGGFRRYRFQRMQAADTTLFRKLQQQTITNH
ncbi:endo- -beta-glucanase, partial [Cystoisospora suis]